MALKARDVNQFLNAMGNMNNAINSPAWSCGVSGRRRC
jgi:hypothetical protein